MSNVAALILIGMFLCTVRAAPAPGVVTDRDSIANPWTHLDFNNEGQSFQFAIVSDRTGGMRRGVFARAVDKINMLQPEFVMSVGDLISGYSEDTTLLKEQWDEFDAIVSRLDMPFFYVPGNHDINNPVMARVWEQRYGRAYYHFLYKDVLFLCLNSEDSAYSHITEEQVAYVREVLKKHEAARWTFVFLHKPFWARADSTAWLKVEPLLEGRDYTVFAGHQHNYISFQRNGQAYYQLATTGGGSQLQGAESGTFDHLMWVTVKRDEGPRVAVLSLEGILVPDHRTERIARLQDQLHQDIAVRVEPLYAEKKRGTEFATSLLVANAAENAVRFAGSLTAGGFSLARPESFAATIEPGTEKRFEVLLKSDRPRAVDELQAAQLNWEAAFAGPEVPIRRRARENLRLANVYECPRRKKEVRLDGSLDDWAELTYACTEPAQVLKDPRSWRGPDDCRFGFGVSYDKDYVYVAIDVFDDTLVSEPDGYPWTQDGVEVRIDARPDSIRAHGRSEGEFSEIMLFALSPGKNDSTMVVFRRQKLPKGSHCVCRPTDTGHATEIAVPVSWLNEKQGKQWEAFRLNVAVDDSDQPGTVAQLWWLPEWRGEKTYAGSGTFRKMR